MLYWITGTPNSSGRLYFESTRTGASAPFEQPEGFGEDLRAFARLFRTP